jgi:hypothetical protein
MLRRVALIRTDVSEERIASITTVIRNGELGKTLALTSSQILVTAMIEEKRSSETMALTRTTRRNGP